MYLLQKILKKWDILNNHCVLKLNSLVFKAVMHLKDGDGIANCVDPDQTAPEGAV